MNNTWVKLYRKINMNSIMSDPIALQLFIWVLTNVDKDNGEVEFGRYFVAKQLKVNPNTLYSALKRLVSKYKVCEISSTGGYTTIRLLNWAKYQPSKEDINTSINTPSTTTQHVINTLQEERIENREYIRERSISYLIELPIEDINDFTDKFVCSKSQVQSKATDLYFYCKSKGKLYKDYKALLRNALSKDFGVRTNTQNAVDYVRQKEAELEREGNLSFTISSDEYKKIGKPMS